MNGSDRDDLNEMIRRYQEDLMQYAKHSALCSAEPWLQRRNQLYRKYAVLRLRVRPRQYRNRHRKPGEEKTAPRCSATHADAGYIRSGGSCWKPEKPRRQPH